MNPTLGLRLTHLTRGGGCACKLSMDELEDVLSGLSLGEHRDLEVDFRLGDDAAVWRRPDGRHLVATTDFFTPIVDDPRTWGEIVAVNAVSDIYAMGATPLFALNLLGWPRDLPFEVLREVLQGGSQGATRAGYVIAGGHTIDTPEPLYGQAVIGELPQGAPLTNAGGHDGDALILTKPLGTGIATTAAKRSEPTHVEGPGLLGVAYRAAVASMTRLNDVAASIARDAEASACTDVTGFGLLGHAHRLAVASQLSVHLNASQVPVLPGVHELYNEGFVPGGTQRNIQQARRYLSGEVPLEVLGLLADAQTSGGLLFACPRPQVKRTLAALCETGHDAAAVGTLRDGAAGQVLVSP